MRQKRTFSVYFSITATTDDKKYEQYCVIARLLQCEILKNTYKLEPKSNRPCIYIIILLKECRDQDSNLGYYGHNVMS